MVCIAFVVLGDVGHKEKDTGTIGQIIEREESSYNDKFDQ
jgi:hypothetical protein